MTILENISLKAHNTFGIEAVAQSFAELHTFMDLQIFLDTIRGNKKPLLILGGGSNILFTKNFDGIVAKICTKGIIKLKETGDQVFLNVQAGEKWNDFVKYCLENNYGGVENLSLIPGTVGACPIQNIGAYGAEVKDVTESVEILDTVTLQMDELSNAGCRFGYRNSIFKHELKGKVIITSVNFRLSRKPVIRAEYGAIKDELELAGVTNPGIKDVANAVIKIRSCKLPDPEKTGNAGSFFKNPQADENTFTKLKSAFPDIPFYSQPDKTYKIPAGWLIEHSGWKGYREGDAGVHANQALVLINFGNASGKDILNLAKKIQKSVSGKFGITLETEVNVI